MSNNPGFNELKLDKENQQFNTFDVLSMVLCFIMVISIGGVVFRSHLNQQKASIAKGDVENLAQELIMKPVISSQDLSSRIPASVEDSAIDPWGVAYKYSVI